MRSILKVIAPEKFGIWIYRVYVSGLVAELYHQEKESHT